MYVSGLRFKTFYPDSVHKRELLSNEISVHGRVEVLSKHQKNRISQSPTVLFGIKSLRAKVERNNPINE